MQLLATMTQRTLTQQVHRTSACVYNPVNGGVAIDEAQHLYTLQSVYLAGVSADHLHSLLLAVADSCRCHFDAIYVQVAQQHAGNHQLLMGQETHAAGLLAIAQRGVHDLNESSRPTTDPSL